MKAIYLLLVIQVAGLFAAPSGESTDNNVETYDDSYYKEHYSQFHGNHRVSSDEGLPSDGNSNIVPGGTSGLLSGGNIIPGGASDIVGGSGVTQLAGSPLGAVGGIKDSATGIVGKATDIVGGSGVTQLPLGAVGGIKDSATGIVGKATGTLSNFGGAGELVGGTGLTNILG